MVEDGESTTLPFAAPPVSNPLPTELVVLEQVQATVVDPPGGMTGCTGVIPIDGGGVEPAGPTFTLVHTPQLSFSFDSAITPALVELLLSAHARIECMPSAAKV